MQEIKIDQQILNQVEEQKVQVKEAEDRLTEGFKQLDDKVDSVLQWVKQEKDKREDEIKQLMLLKAKNE